MQIQEQGPTRKISSQDQWQPRQIFQQNQKNTKASLFSKITIDYNDKIIQKNILIECEKPILNSNIFSSEDQDQGQLGQFELQQLSAKMSQQPQTQKDPLQNQKRNRSKKIQNSSKNEQAFFNAVEDDENQVWIRKKLQNKLHSKYENRQQRPLTCPQCFTQVCYAYQILNKKQIDQGNQLKEVKDGNIPSQNQKSYITKFLDNIKIHQHKIIRNRFAPQRMTSKFNSEQKVVKQNSSRKDLQDFERDLKARYQDINIKILISCQQCDFDLGFWDANEQMYVLFNVI